MDASKRAYFYYINGYGDNADKNHRRAEKMDIILKLGNTYGDDIKMNVIEKYQDYKCRCGKHNSNFALWSHNFESVFTKWICDECFIRYFDIAARDTEQFGDMELFHVASRRFAISVDRTAMNNLGFEDELAKFLDAINK